MTVLVPRIRTLGVRLSEEEYSALEKLCLQSGARSISDLARTAICGFVNQRNQENALACAANANATQVKDLEEKLAQLCAEIELLKARKMRDETAGNAGESQPL